MCKKNLKKQNVVEELGWGRGGRGFQKKALKRPTQREKIKKKGGGGGGAFREKKALKCPTEREKGKKVWGGRFQKKH